MNTQIPDPQDDIRMTRAQEAHLEHLKASFCREIDRKYRAGAKEHKGDIRDNSAITILQFALDEAIDQVSYIQTAIDKLVEEEEDRKLQGLADASREESHSEAV